MPGKATARAGNDIPAEMPPFEKMLRDMGAIATLEETSPSEFERDDMAPILNATTEDEMWDADELPTYNAKKLSGTDLQILGFEVKFGREREADEEEMNTRLIDPATGKHMFLLVHSRRITKAQKDRSYRLPEVGEFFAWNTSARYIVPKLWWMLHHGWFDTGHEAVYVHINGVPLKRGQGQTVERLKPYTGPAVAFAEVETIAEDETTDTPF